MITFIESGNRIATENFETGEIYTITYTNGNYRTMCCIGIGTDFVMFQGTSPNALFCLTLGTSETVSTIELGGGGSGTMNYNELENKPQINGIVLIGNKTASDLNLVSQNDLDNYVTDTELSTELADYATNASVVSALASKQDTLTTTQLTAVNSGITSADVTQITTNKNNISSLQSKVLSYTDVVIDLHDDVTWAQGVQGIYYSTTVTVPNMGTIYAVSITSLSSIPDKSGLIPRIDGTTKIGLYADTGTWETSQRVTIRAIGIEST